MTPRTIFLVFFGLTFGLTGLRAEKLAIAAAANLTYALGALDEAYIKANPGDPVTIITGASGNLFAQIKNGAPIDVFLSADVDYPKKLAAAGAADAGTLAIFSTGRLVLWTAAADFKLTDVTAALADSRVKHIAIANPATAPYGRAARETLAALGLAKAAEAKLVTGENISQTFQFVQTGNAEIGFVALSLVLSPSLKEKGNWLAIPATLHESLDQGAIITKHGAANPAARRYLEFLKSPAARDVLRRFGYGVP